jgi:hypothetical protein
MLTAWPAFGRLAVRTGIGRLPEEVERPAVLLDLGLPAIELVAPRPNVA